MADSLSQIRERYRNGLEGDFPSQDVAGSPVFNMKELWARVERSIQERQDVENRARSPRSAVGSDLDGWGQFLGMTRSEATRATATASVSSSKTGRVLQQSASSRFLPAGQILEASSGQAVELASQLEIPLTSRSSVAQVQAMSRGPVARVPAGSKLSLPPAISLSGDLTITLDEDLAGGQARESDEQYRFRLSKALFDPSTIEGLIGILLGDPAVNDVSLEEGVYGIGTAEVEVSPAVPYPTEEDRARIEALAEGGPSNAMVVFPSYEGLSFRIRIAEEPSSEELEELKPQVQQAVASYVNELQTGERAQMERLERRVFDRIRRGAQVVAVRRGRVSPDGEELLGTTSVGDVLGLSPRSADHSFYVREGWVAVCA